MDKMPTEVHSLVKFLEKAPDTCPTCGKSLDEHSESQKFYCWMNGD